MLSDIQFNDCSTNKSAHVEIKEIMAELEKINNKIVIYLIEKQFLHLFLNPIFEFHADLLELFCLVQNREMALMA